MKNATSSNFKKKVFGSVAVLALAAAAFAPAVAFAAGNAPSAPMDVAPGESVSIQLDEQGNPVGEPMKGVPAGVDANGLGKSQTVSANSNSLYVIGGAVLLIAVVCIGAGYFVYSKSAKKKAAAGVAYVVTSQPQDPQS